MQTNPLFSFSRVLLLAFCVALPAWAAQPLVRPEQAVILTVTGNIERTNSNGKAIFDREMLDQLSQHGFFTGTPWTGQKHHFSGVLLSDLLNYLGAEGENVRVIALNDYHNDLSMNMVRKHPFLLSTRLDGEIITVRDKGPLWVMLPLSEHSEYDTKRYHEMLVWQVKQLDIQ